MLRKGSARDACSNKAVEMLRLIPHAQLAIFPNADHFMIFMQPKKLQFAIFASLDAAEK
jgi:pimeloyl-ACP methyl ester carboxylesterase